jgi:hypothetical protein
MAMTVNLHNNAWNAGIRTEVHVGNNQDPDLNASQGIRVVNLGDQWSITAAENVQWRRDQDPNTPTGQWTEWNEKAYTDDANYNYDL